MKKLLIITLLFSLPLIAEEKKDIPTELTTQNLKAYLGNLAELPGVDAILQPYVDACLANTYYRGSPIAFEFLEEMLLNYKAALSRGFIDNPQSFVFFIKDIIEFIRSSSTLSLTLLEFRAAQNKILSAPLKQSVFPIVSESMDVEPILSEEEERRLEALQQGCIDNIDYAATRG